MNKKLWMFLIFAMLFVTPCAIYAAGDTTVQNGGFEEIAANEVKGWSKGSWKSDNNSSEFLLDEKVFKSGSKSACIINPIPNDSRYQQEVKVKPDYFYKVSCWIKTQDVGTSEKGANISVQNILNTSKDIKGSTSNWEYVELYGRTGSNQKSFVLTLGLGGYGSLNTGKAWFDDVKIEEFKELPKGVSAANFYNSNTDPSSSLSNGKESLQNDYAAMINKIILYYFVSLCAICISFLTLFHTKKDRIKKSPANSSLHSRHLLYIMLTIGFIFRLAVAPVIEGHPIDISCFKSWASIASNNLAGFYKNDMFVDYPPVYIYVLFFMAKIAKLFGFISINWAYTLIIKFPSLVADVFTSYLIYKLSENKLSPKGSLLLTGIYLFNPVVILNSALWGQVDSFFTLLIVGALWLLMSDNLKGSSVLYCAAILMKPQGIIFLPVLFFDLLRRKRVMNFVTCFLYAAVSAIIILLPFSLSQNPLWIFKLFINTASGYKGASINAFNFFALLGANWKDDSLSLFIFSYKTWGILFIVLVTSFAWFLYIKGKGPALPLITSMVLITGVFVLSSKMHERYLFPVMAICLMAFILLKDKRLLWFYAGFSITGFINTYVVFALSLNKVYWVPANDLTLKLVSLANVLLFGYLLKVSFDVLIRNRLSLVTMGFHTPAKQANRKKGKKH